MKLDHLFPNIVGYVDNENHNNIENKLYKKCLKIQKNTVLGGEEWISSSVYNTFGKYNIIKDKDFNILNKWVFNKIEEYSNLLNYKNKFLPLPAWFNIYNKYDYQEVHDHSPATLSAIYYLKGNKETCARTYFYSPSADGLQPEVTSGSILNSNKVWYETIPGRLLIFRSNLKHCVERQESEDVRVSIAYNFYKK
jgi:uncharacterized protein (TIGR02466 family)